MFMRSNVHVCMCMHACVCVDRWAGVNNMIFILTIKEFNAQSRMDTHLLFTEILKTAEKIKHHFQIHDFNQIQ